MIRAPVPSPEWLRYRDPFRDLAQRADLFADICRLLPRYQSFFAPAARGTLQDTDGTEFVSEHGLGLWVHPRLAVTEFTQSFVYGRFRAGGWGEEPVPRALQMARISDPDLGFGFACAHLHGLRDAAGKGDTANRRTQCKTLVQAIQSFRVSAQERFVLAGDLNVLPDNPMFAELARIGLHDQVTGRGHKDTRTSLYTKPQRFADYLLASKSVDIADFQLPAMPEVSDHRPLVLDIKTSGSTAI